MEFKMENLPIYRIAYVRQMGPYGLKNVQTMETLKNWAKKNHLLSETAIILGISHDNPETTLPENCRYDAGIVISNDYQINDDSISEDELPGGKYAIYKVKHTAEAIQKAWAAIYSDLQNNTYQLDAKPIFERYIVEMLHTDYCEICVPIKSQG